MTIGGAALAGLGWKQAALAISQVFGTSFAQYRPGTAAAPATTALLPLQSGNLIAAALPGYVTQNAFAKTPLPLDPDKPRCHAVFDPAVLAVGDYLTGSIQAGGTVETFYIASLQSPAPPGAVRCTAIVNVTRGVMPTGFGAQASIDEQIGNETVVMQGWPCNIIREGRGERGDAALPSDVKLGGHLILMPASVPTALRSGDVLTVTSWLTNPNDPGGLRIELAMAVSSSDGWKLLGQEVMT